MTTFEDDPPVLKIDLTKVQDNPYRIPIMTKGGGTTMTKSIKEVLMERDGLTSDEADEFIAAATEDMYERLADGEMPFDLCEEWFGLEPDYLNQLM